MSQPLDYKDFLLNVTDINIFKNQLQQKSHQEYIAIYNEQQKLITELQKKIDTHRQREKQINELTSKINLLKTETLDEIVDVPPPPPLPSPSPSLSHLNFNTTSSRPLLTKPTSFMDQNTTQDMQDNKPENIEFYEEWETDETKEKNNINETMSKETIRDIKKNFSDTLATSLKVENIISRQKILNNTLQAWNKLKKSQSSDEEHFKQQLDKITELEKILESNTQTRKTKPAVKQQNSQSNLTEVPSTISLFPDQEGVTPNQEEWSLDMIPNAPPLPTTNTVSET